MGRLTERPTSFRPSLVNPAGRPARNGRPTESDLSFTSQLIRLRSPTQTLERPADLSPRDHHTVALARAHSNRGRTARSVLVRGIEIASRTDTPRTHQRRSRLDAPCRRGGPA